MKNKRQPDPERNRKHTVYLGGEYLLISNHYYFLKKYDTPTTFILEGTAEQVLGDDWSSTSRITTINLTNRLKSQGKTLESVNEPILYGKIKQKGSVFLLAELVLLSEIAFCKSLAEFDELKKYNKIKELTIKN
jgi:hypothetical protein